MFLATFLLDLPPLRSPQAISEPTVGEERANVITHGVGAVAAVAAASLLIVLASLAGEPRQIVTLSVFGAALTAVYLISSFYHAARRPGLKRLLRKLDHGAIFLLIAGTYTPLMLVTLGGGWGWSLFGVVWGLAVVGLILKLVCFDRFGWAQLGLKLGMGWLIFIALGPVVAAFSTPGLCWVAAGGAAYTLGVGFFLWERLRYNHAVWHLWVIAGSACHVMAMVTDVLPAS
ncbi:MAG: hemolysin III family protein [Planctomycetota bacterium]